MKWEFSIAVPNGVLDAEPVANPDTPPVSKIFRLTPEAKPQDRGITKALLCCLDAPSGANITVSFYSIDDATLPVAGPDADTKYCLITSGVVLTANEIATVSTNMVPQGAVFMRVTAETLGADAVVRIEGVDR